MSGAAWQEWQGSGLEHLVLDRHDGEGAAESIVICPGDKPFAVRYRVVWDAAWLTKRVEVEMIGTEARLVLTSDGRGNWAKDGRPMPELQRRDRSRPHHHAIHQHAPDPTAAVEKRTKRRHRDCLHRISFNSSSINDPQRYTCLARRQALSL